MGAWDTWNVEINILVYENENFHYRRASFNDATASTVTVQLTDVLVFDVKEKLQAISNAELEDKLDSCLKDFEEKFVSGYNKFLIKQSDKADDFLQKV